MNRARTSFIDLASVLGLVFGSLRIRILAGVGLLALGAHLATQWIPPLVAFGLFLVFSYGLLEHLFGRRFRSLLLMARMADGVPVASDDVFRGHDELARIARAVAGLADRMRRSNTEAREQTSKLEEVFSSIGDGVIIVSPEGRILKVNNTVRRWLGCYGDVAGKRLVEITRSVELADKVASMARALDGGGLAPETLEPLHLQGVEAKVVRAKIVATRLAGNRWALMIFLFDVTDFHRLQEIRREFFSNASHELKTPLAAIRGYAEALEDMPNYGSVPMVRDFLEIILRNCKQLTGMVDEMLMLAGLESGALPMQIADYDLEAGVERVFETCRPKAHEAGVELMVDIAVEARRIRVDGQRFDSVLLNLVDNGIKYNREGGYVKVSARASARELVVYVEDSGIGIPDSALPRAFERFYRVDKSHTRLGGGSGLGLAVVKHIVMAHGGQISVRSEVNVGTVFTLTLPWRPGQKLSAVSLW